MEIMAYQNKVNKVLIQIDINIEKIIKMIMILIITNNIFKSKDIIIVPHSLKYTTNDKYIYRINFIC